MDTKFDNQKINSKLNRVKVLLPRLYLKRLQRARRMIAMRFPEYQKKEYHFNRTSFLACLNSLDSKL